MTHKTCRKIQLNLPRERKLFPQEEKQRYGPWLLCKNLCFNSATQKEMTPAAVMYHLSVGYKHLFTRAVSDAQQKPNKTLWFLINTRRDAFFSAKLTSTDRVINRYCYSKKLETLVVPASTFIKICRTYCLFTLNYKWNATPACLLAHYAVCLYLCMSVCMFFFPKLDLFIWFSLTSALSPAVTWPTCQ